MIKLAVTNLGKYNEGNLVYAWLTLPATEEEIKECLDSIGINEEYEEYFNSDHETDIEGLEIGEYTSIDSLNTIAESYDNLDTSEQDILSSILEANGGTFEQAMEILESQSYQFYQCDSLEDLAQEMFDEGLWGDTSAMGTLANYIDFERLGRDLGFDGYTVTSKGIIRLD